MGKTECIIFGSKRKLNKIKDFKIVSNGHTINSQSSVKYLGINIDQSVSGEAIAKNIIQKSNSRLRFLYRQGACLNQQTRKTLCSALLQCLFDYSASAWYSGVSIYHKKKLQVSQNKIVRFIKNLHPRHHVGQEELSSLGYLNVKDRVKFLRLNHVHKIFNHTNAPYMSEFFPRTSDTHHYNTRSSSHNFVIPRVRSTVATTFYYNAITDWNALPEHIKSIGSKDVFKKTIKTFITNQSREQEANNYVRF